jgi:outer membrane protein OmpA-like peptidoglycan-associated protein
MLSSSYALLTGCSTISGAFSSPDMAEDDVVIEEAITQNADVKEDDVVVKADEKSTVEQDEKIEVSDGEPVRGLVADEANIKYDEEYSRQEVSVVRPLVDKKELEARVLEMETPPEPVKTTPVEVSKLDLSEEKQEVAEAQDAVAKTEASEPLLVEKQTVGALAADEAVNISQDELTTPVYASDLDRLLNENRKNLAKLSKALNDTSVRLVDPSSGSRAYDYKMAALIPAKRVPEGLRLVAPDPSVMVTPIISSASSVSYSSHPNILPNLDVETFDNSFDMNVPAQVVIDGSGAREIPQNVNEYIDGNAGVSFLASTIYHRHGSDRLSDEDLEKIHHSVNLARRYGGKIRIVGHASSRTREMPLVKHMMTNFTMSMNRAQTVSKALIETGFPKENIYVTAVSDAEPVFYEVMPSGEAGNRRTEIYLDY